MAAAEPELPECVCVHCGVRFNARELTYGVDTALLPPALAAAWTPLRRDSAATAFLLRAGSRSALQRAAQDAVASALRSALSLTDANALVGRGAMHVLSTQQAAALLSLPWPADDDNASATGQRPPPPAPPLGSLLDVGAGDGGVTAQLATLFGCVAATEASEPMARRLRRNPAVGAVLSGAAAADLAAAPAACRAAGLGGVAAAGFDVVSCLNVLDRCDAPLDLLRGLAAALRPGGVLLLGVVLPFRPFVEEGPARRAPRQALGLRRDGRFEACLAQLWADVLAPAGLGGAARAAARVPYLSEGDSEAPAYSLDCALLVLRPGAAAAALPP